MKLDEGYINLLSCVSYYHCFLRIDSAHNRQVISYVAAETTTTQSLDQIRSELHDCKYNHNNIQLYGFLYRGTDCIQANSQTRIYRYRDTEEAPTV